MFRMNFLFNISIVQHLHLVFDKTNELLIKHNFNTRKIGYFIYDDTGRQFIPDEFRILNDSEVLVKFESPTAGEIIVFAFKKAGCIF